MFEVVLRNGVTSFLLKLLISYTNNWNKVYVSINFDHPF